MAVRKVEVRVVAATNYNLRDRIAEKLFREDLYYRLSMVELHTPNLVDRKEDLPLLESYFIKKFEGAGYTFASTKTELAAAAGKPKLLGLFNTSNVDGALDRMFLKKGTVDKFPDQPGLVQMTTVAIDQLSKNPDGFFVMIEGASVDKQKHTMDWERAEFDMIEFDQAVGVAQAFVAEHPDTLLIVTGDHTHGNSLIGTIDDSKGQGRDAVGVYADAGFLGYDCVLVEDACATVSPDFVRDAVLYLVRLLHGVVANSDAIFSAIGMPDPAPQTKVLERNAP